MSQQNNLTSPPVHPASLGTRLLQGAGTALLLISVFLLQVRKPDPAWPELWVMRPMLIVPLAGALGAVFYYSMDHLRVQGRGKRIFANILSLLVYLSSLWLGSILGLKGTLRN